MSRNPNERFATAHELSRDLEAWVAGERVSADHEPWHEALWRWTSKHRVGVVAGAGLLLVALVGLTAAALISAARNSATVKTNEAAFFRELSLVAAAENQVTHTLNDALKINQVGNAQSSAPTTIIQSLLDLLENPDRERREATSVARAYLDLKARSEEQNEPRAGAALKTLRARIADSTQVIEKLVKEFPFTQRYRALLGQQYSALRNHCDRAPDNRRRIPIGDQGSACRRSAKRSSTRASIGTVREGDRNASEQRGECPKILDDELAWCSFVSTSTRSIYRSPSRLRQGSPLHRFPD